MWTLWHWTSFHATGKNTLHISIQKIPQRLGFNSVLISESAHNKVENLKQMAFNRKSMFSFHIIYFLRKYCSYHQPCTRFCCYYVQCSIVNTYLSKQHTNTLIIKRTEIMKCMFPIVFKNEFQ